MLQKSRRKIVASVSTISILIVAAGGSALSASADSTGGYFKIQADLEAGKYTAIKGFYESEQDGGSGTPVTPPDDSLSERLAQFTCGTEDVNLTEAMLQLSDDNRERLAQGEMPVPHSDGWTFIWESSSYGGADVGLPVTQDKILTFSNNPAGNNYFMIDTEAGSEPFMTAKTSLYSAGSPAEDYVLSDFSDNKGALPASISYLEFEIGGNTVTMCNYVNVVDGEYEALPHTSEIITSGSGAGDSHKTFKASNNYPVTNEPAVIWSAGGSTLEFSWLPGNGERWNYGEKGDRLWHPASSVTEWDHGGVESFTYVDSFSQDDNIIERLAHPIAQEYVSSIAEANETEYRYISPTATNGYNYAIVTKRANGSIKDGRYYLKPESNERPSRLNGPAFIAENADGSINNQSYIYDGSLPLNRNTYEGLGGTNWLGHYENGVRITASD